MAATAATSVVSTSLSIDQCNIVRRGRQCGNAHSEQTRHAAGTTFDDKFMDLMRLVIHHVADEETQLLPAAERLLLIASEILR